MRKIRLGMVGGGQGAFIGAVHRIAARIDNRYELVAGALSSNAERSIASALELNIDKTRAYSDFYEMAKQESKRDDGIEAVSIVTPNHMHVGPAIAFLEAGINVICDKPLSSSYDDALSLEKVVRKSGNVRFFLTHNYTGYPLIREARNMIKSGKLGKIRIIQAEYAQDWLTEEIEKEGQKQASWRTDPKLAGGGAIGDIGTHAFNLIRFVSNLNIEAIASDLHSFGEDRQVDDNAHILIRLQGGARSMLWVSQVAVGNENNLCLRIYGDKGSLEWKQENPNRLIFSEFGKVKQMLSRGGAGTSANWTRIPPGHPEGYLEGFANIYNDIADVIQNGGSYEHIPDINDGLEGMKFITKVIESSKNNSSWVKW